MAKPFDSKIEHRLDESAPALEFEYKGTQMNPRQAVGAVIVASCGAVPFAAIPWILSRRLNRVRIDMEGIRIGLRRRGKWKVQAYPRERVSRLRTKNVSWQTGSQGKVAQVVFDYGTREVPLFQNLSEPELLWLYNETLNFVERHWGKPEAPERL